MVWNHRTALWKITSSSPRPRGSGSSAFMMTMCEASVRSPPSSHACQSSSIFHSSGSKLSEDEVMDLLLRGFAVMPVGNLVGEEAAPDLVQREERGILP